MENSILEKFLKGKTLNNSALANALGIHRNTVANLLKTDEGVQHLNKMFENYILEQKRLNSINGDHKATEALEYLELSKRINLKDFTKEEDES